MRTIRRGQATVLSLAAEDLADAPSVEAAFDEITSFLDRKHIVVDMRGVRRITSMGLSALSAGAEMARSRSGRFALAGLRPEVRRLVELADAGGLIDLADDVDGALREMDADVTNKRR